MDTANEQSLSSRVWIIWDNADYYGPHMVSIWSTKELAEEGLRCHHRPGDCYIETYTLDPASHLEPHVPLPTKPKPQKEKSPLEKCLDKTMQAYWKGVYEQGQRNKNRISGLEELVGDSNRQNRQANPNAA